MEEALRGTIRVQAESKSRDDEARTPRDSAESMEDGYRSLTEGALYGIYRSTIDGRFLTVNPALVEMLGYDSASELLQVDLARDIYARPEERAELIERYRGCERIEGVEVDWRRRDGETIRVRLSGRRVRDWSRSDEHFEMIVEDVSERRVLEAQLRQSQKMEAVGQLTGGIAHDFNNLLTIIMANAELLSGELLPSRADLRAVVDETLVAAQRGADLIKKLLSFSRRSKLELKPVDFCQLADGLVGVLRRILPENVEIKLVARQSEKRGHADPGAVEQILLNLITNARDAMPDGGTLTIEIGEDWLDEGYHATHPWVEPGEYMSLTVSDTGVGMDELTQERMFEPFFTTKQSGRGTGLGMAMIYGLVKQHRGYIHVYSELGRGTTVKVYFPMSCEVAAVEPIPSTDPRELPRGSETILVVEDDPAIQRATRRALENYGYTVSVASDGEEALEHIRQREGNLDLIITDLVMPKLGGRQLYEVLRRDGRDVGVVFASGYSPEDVRESAAVESTVPFLHKPWTLADLLGTVREVLDSRACGRYVRDGSDVSDYHMSMCEFDRQSVAPVTASAWMTEALR